MHNAASVRLGQGDGGGGGGGSRGKPGRGFQLQVSRGERETVMQDEKLALECAAKAYLQRLS